MENNESVGREDGRMKRLVVGVVTSLVLLCCQNALAVGPSNKLAPYFKGYDGAFVLLDLKKGTWIRYNNARCAKRFSPCSTFKIPNSLIGIETGAVPDVDEEIKWDGKDRKIAAWNRDHSMRTAFADSVVWYYRRLAEAVGEKRMCEYLNKMNYGNKDISGGLTDFWLDSSLKISANEQVEFLRKLTTKESPFSAKTISIVRDIMKVETTPEYTFSGKTGSAMQNGKRSLAWFVGYLDKGDKHYAFATNISATDIQGRHPAKNITKAVLRHLGIM